MQQRPYFQFTERSRLDKSINTILGLMEGIAIDGLLTDVERARLDEWIRQHVDAERLHPFTELLPRVRGAMEDGRIDEEERADFAWLCRRLRSTEFYDQSSADLQRLHAVLGGIAADSEISKLELARLREWLEEHEHLRTCWPYDEVSSLITGVLADGVIDASEHELLLAFFGEFSELERRPTDAAMLERVPVDRLGICATCPDVVFSGMKFCFTGDSSRCSRKELCETVVRLGGSVVSGVSGKVDYLVVGAAENPCWAYACYGRKIEQAMLIRKQGGRIVIVQEYDFHDAVADAGG